MEFEDVSAEVEREARRVAAAFGVSKWERWQRASLPAFRGFQGDGSAVRWDIEMSGAWFRIEVGPLMDGCEVSKNDDFGLPGVPSLGIPGSGPPGEWSCFCRRSYSHLYRQPMAYGLFRLGFEDEGVLAELNCPLTAHEKLELRLSMPREFWPQKWLEEA